MTFRFAHLPVATRPEFAHWLQATWRRLSRPGRHDTRPHGFGLLVDLHDAHR